MPGRVLILVTVLLGCTTATRGDGGDGAFTKRGPLDKHAGYVQQVLDTLDVSPQQKTQLERIVADGHVAWRTWYRKNHEKVDAYQAAIQAAKASGDRQKLKTAMKAKKVFMHTAPSLLRYPEPARAVLSEDQRRLFDERLLELKRKLHRPPKK